jgi:hypothetical protein
MRRVLAVLVVSTVAGFLVAGAATPASRAKAFPTGCWKGKGHGTIIGISSPAPGVTVNLDKASYTFKLGVFKSKDVIGFLDFVGHGTGSVSAGGTTTYVELALAGKMDLTGTPSKVVMNGDVDMKGVAMVGATSIPLDFSGPVTNVPLTIKAVAPTKVTGTAGKSVWTALRVGKPCIT